MATDEQQIEISEAMIQQVLQAFRRSLKPMTIEEIAALLKSK